MSGPVSSSSSVSVKPIIMSVSGAVGSLTHSLTEHQISHVVITALRSLKIYQPIRSLSLSTFPSCMANMWAHDDDGVHR